MLELRPYRPGDAAAIVSWIDSELTFYRWSAGRYGAYPISPEVLEQSYADCGPDGPWPLVMTDDGVPAAHLLMRRPTQDRSVIRFGFVLLDPARRGRGDGHQLLTMALDHAFRFLGASRVTIGVFEDNLPARRCYQRVGFREQPELTAHYAILGEDWTCLELAIDRP